MISARRAFCSWLRIADTFGAHPLLVSDMGRAYCDGMQSDPAQNGGYTAYDFGFGLNWYGVIHDGRTLRYGKNC